MKDGNDTILYILSHFRHDISEEELKVAREYLKKCDTLESLLKEAEQALEPFADIFNGKNTPIKSGDYILQRDHIRRAAEVLKKLRGGAA